MKKYVLPVIIVIIIISTGNKIYAKFLPSDLIYPLSGSTFKAGDVVDVKWDIIEGYSYSNKSCVYCFDRIIIKHNGVIVDTIDTIENDGEERIKIPNNTPPGEYQMFLYWNNYSMGPHNASGEDFVGTFYVVSNPLGISQFILIAILVLFIIFILIKLKKNK